MSRNSGKVCVPMMRSLRVVWLVAASTAVLDSTNCEVDEELPLSNSSLLESTQLRQFDE
jgi:hypothetical protein